MAGLSVWLCSTRCAMSLHGCVAARCSVSLAQRGKRAPMAAAAAPPPPSAPAAPAVGACAMRRHHRESMRPRRVAQPPQVPLGGRACGLNAAAPMSCSHRRGCFTVTDSACSGAWKCPALSSRRGHPPHPPRQPPSTHLAWAPYHYRRHRAPWHRTPPSRHRHHARRQMPHSAMSARIHRLPRCCRAR